MNNCERRGFTLIELLVVIAVIALLVMLMVPTFMNTREHTRATVCKKNLSEMAKGIITAPERRPYPGQWRRFIMDRGMSSVLSCPSDPDIEEAPDSQDFPDLDDIYLVQKQGSDLRFSNIQVILDTGTSLEDNQVNLVDSAHGINALAGQKLILVGSECALLRVTYGSRVKFESMIVSATHGCASIHWLCVDDGRADWKARVKNGLASASVSGEHKPDPSIFVMRLQSGPKYTTPWPDYEVRSEKADYAMSDAVDNVSPRSGQLMLVEYCKDVAKVMKQGYTTDEFGDSNEDEDGCLRTRHFGMANFATTDGSVKSMTREQLQWEYDIYTANNPKGFWAP